MKTKIIKAVVAGATYLATNENSKKTILGTYSDGSTRCLIDAIGGEFISPNGREEIVKKIRNNNR